ncbi:MAG: hypothetical protein ACRDVD_07340 [Acidimicrobiia bacterium]
MREEGSASLELALGMAMLVIPAVVMVASFSIWLEARAFVRAGAAEGARAAVLAEGDPAAAGTAVVADMATGRGFPPDEVTVSMCGGPSLAAGSGSGSCILDRGVLVTASVSVEVPLVETPWGEVGGVKVAASHAEPVDAYRSLP